MKQNCYKILVAIFLLLTASGVNAQLISTVAGNGVGGILTGGGPATDAELAGPVGIAVDPSNQDVYIADSANNIVRKVDHVTGAITTIAGGGTDGSLGYAGLGTGASLLNPTGVAVDYFHNVYIAEYGANLVRKVNALGWMVTVAGTGASGFLGDGGPATAAYLSGPYAVRVDGTGRVYVADRNNNVVRRIVVGDTIGTFAGINPSAGFGLDGGPATMADLHNPTGVAYDPATGNIYVADQENNVVRMITPGGIISTVAGDILLPAGYTTDGVQATGTNLNAPTGVAYDNATGSLYIADAGNNRIRKVSSSGIITTYAGTGVAGHTGDGSAATGATLSGPTGVCYVAGIGLFIADAGNSAVRLVNTGGTITLFAGTYTSGYTYDGDIAIASEVNLPPGVAVDATGNIFIADSANNVIREISGGNITTVAGVAGVAGFGGDGGIATLAYLNGPMGVAVSGGTLYIADANNNRIRAVNLGTGNISTFAGTGAYGQYYGVADLFAIFAHPTGVAVDLSGNVYVADHDNHCVCKVAGTVTAFAGQPGVSGYLGDGSLAISAFLNDPTGVAVDNGGNVYIADAGNGAVRMVNSGTHIIYTVAGVINASGYNGDGPTATDQQLNNPTGVAIDLSGNVIIADAGNNLIRSVALSGGMTTIAGNLSGGYTADGVSAITTDINNAAGVAVDPTTGNVILADTRNNRIRYINGAGIINTIGGNGIRGYGGRANKLMLHNPTNTSYDGTNLYIADAGNNVIRKVDATGVISTFAGNTVKFHSGDHGNALLAAINDPKGVVYDPSHACIYIAETDSGNIRVVPLATNIITTMAGSSTLSYAGEDDDATNAEMNFPYGICVDPTGTVIIADAKNERVRHVYENLSDPLTYGRIFTIAGNIYTDSGYGGHATYLALKQPSGLAFDAAGALYISDQGNNVVRKVDIHGVMHVFAGNGTGGFAGDGGQATGAKLSIPTGVAYDNTNSLLYISDANNNRIRQVNTVTGKITTAVNNAPGTAGYSGDLGSALTAQVNSTVGLDVDPITTGAYALNLFIADRMNNRVREVSHTTGIISTYAGNGIFGNLSSGGPATAAELNAPYGTAYDPVKKLLYIADRDNNMVRRVDMATGNITNLAGNGTAGDLGDGGLAANAVLDGPIAVALTATGDTLYVTDQGNDVIRQIDLNTGMIRLLAGAVPVGGVGGDVDGTGAGAKFYFPTGLCTDVAGNIYVADGNNNSIRKITLAGAVTTIAGEGPYFSGYSGDGGAPLSAELDNPIGVALDPSGSLYIADMGNNVIREIKGSKISTVAGDYALGSGYSGDGGPAVNAQMFEPSGLSCDASGNLLISDLGNNRIRYVSMGTGTIKTIVDNTGTGGFFGDGGNAPLAWINSPFGITVDTATGNYFIADRDNNRVREVKTVLLASYATTGNGICQGSCITFYNTSIGNTDSIRWTTNAPGATMSAATGDTNQICFNTAGDYAVILNIYYRGKSSTYTDSVYISATPDPVITQSYTTLSAIGYYTSYQWVEGSTPIVGEISPYYTYTEAGTYTVIVDSNGCTGTSTYSLTVTMPSLDVNQFSAPAYKYWLSPTQDVNTITLHASQLLSDNLNIAMFDETGREILDDEWKQGSNSIEITAASLPPGLYIIKLTNPTTSAVLKWQKE